MSASKATQRKRPTVRASAAKDPDQVGVSYTKVSEDSEFVNSLYYGDGGTGKTTNLASMANLGRVLYVDAEAGLKKKPLVDLGINVSNIERVSMADLNFKLLEDTWDTIRRDLDSDPDSWAGTVWDSGTEIYHALLDEIVGKRVEKMERNSRQGRSVSDMLLDRFFVDRDNYGVMSEQIRFLLRRFRDLPCHFGISFLERRDQDERTHEVRIGPSITPALQSDVIGWHDVVCRTIYDQASDLYLGIFKPEGVRQGKDRFHALPTPMVDPTFDRIVNYIEGEVEEDSDPRQALLADEEDEPTGADATNGEIEGGEADEVPARKPLRKRPVKARR